MAPPRDWVAEMCKSGPKKDFAELVRQMDYMGLKGAYNPKNLFPGSPFTPTSTPTAAEVENQIKVHGEKILSDWQYLRQIVERHHDVLGKRWAKKTREKQKDLLLEAWPNMSPSHRPDWEAYRQENTGRRHKGLSKYQDAYKFPYINQHDLSSRALIMFITSRARNIPSAFARADLDATQLGTISHMIEEPAFLAYYTMFITEDTMETYGKLVSWDEDESVVDALFSQRQFTPGEGLKVFGLQEKIYPFLIKCCELILHDLVATGSLLDEQYPIIPYTEIIANTVSPISDIVPSLASISVEAPYRLPASLDLNRLRGILAARLSAAEDHLWLMREDPGYFADTIMDWSEHRNDRLLDTRGNPHPIGPHTIEFWQRVIRNTITDAYTSFETWSLLHRLTNTLVELQRKHQNKIAYERELPKDYLIAILRLQQLLKVSCEYPIHNLKNIQSSPPLRHYFIREPQQYGTINIHIKPINELDPHFHKPWGLLLILWDEQQRDLFGLSNIVDAFEQIMQDPTEKRNLSPYMANQFGDLSLLTRALHEIEIYQPWAASFEDDYKQNAMEVIKIMEDATFQMNHVENMDYVLNDIVPLAMPGDGKFNYPADKKRTKHSTDIMRKAESNLDMFWNKFDVNWKRLAKKSIDACMGDHKPRRREKNFERTAEWVEPLKEINPKVDAPKEPKVSTTINDKIAVSVKQKPKKKDIGQYIQDFDALSINEPADKQSVFKVNKASLKVFNTLFFRPGQVGNPGEIPWIDFLRAMISTGFSAQKLYGSIWQFTPTDLDIRKSIQFHEPHPEVKIRFTTARLMGRRLTRAYGWHGDMFELA